MEINDLFVCVTNSPNIIPLFLKKFISCDPSQNIYPNLARTCKNKFYGDEINLHNLNLLKKIYYRIEGSTPPPCQIGLKNYSFYTKYIFQLLF